MPNPTLIQKLLLQYHEKQYTKPKYKVKDLYVGELLVFKNVFFTNGVPNFEVIPIKKFAIFHDYGFGYTHIASGQEPIRRLSALQHDGNYTFNNLRSLNSFAKELNINIDGSKLSKQDILNLENEMNKNQTNETTV